MKEPDTDPTLECRMPDPEEESVQLAVRTDSIPVPDGKDEEELDECVRKVSPRFLKLLKINNSDKIIEMPGG